MLGTTYKSCWIKILFTIFLTSSYGTTIETVFTIENETNSPIILSNNIQSKDSSSSSSSSTSRSSSSSSSSSSSISSSSRFDESLPVDNYNNNNINNDNGGEIENKNNETDYTSLSSTIRKRRYVRFPSNNQLYKFEEPTSNLNFGFNKPNNYIGRQLPYPVWSEYKSSWRNPVMGHRTPRLIFRDDYSRGSVSNSGGPLFLSNQLQDSDDTYRDQRKQISFNDYPRLDVECGISVSKQTAQRRIVGGDEAGFGSFPWQAYIRIGSSRCGGTLVNRFHVVTAGHCVAKASARQVQVTLGDYVVNSAVEPLPAYTFGVREIRVHPYFKFTPQADRFDVAVLRLDRPVHYMPHIAPICLPDKNEDFLGQYGWAAGWGALQAGSRLRPKTLQAVDVPVIDNRVCERWHRSNGINVIIYDEMMCAGYSSGGKDSCQGDSGGPLMLEKTGRWYLIGIVSAGYSCAQSGQPGIYHRVAKTVDWITYIINS